MRTRKLLYLVGIFLVMALTASPSVGFIHFPPPTLPKLCQQATNIRVLAVKKHDQGRGVIVYEVAQTLKGENPKGMSFKHAIRPDVAGVKPIFDWVGGRKQAVMYTVEGSGIACGYVFIDQFCYSVDYNRAGDFWLLIRTDPEMAATFFGTVKTLQAVTKAILAGKEVKVPVDESVKALTTKEREKFVPALNKVLTKNRGQ
jgi:hypothetical protein